jgi:hypothetical protein
MGIEINVGFIGNKNTAGDNYTALGRATYYKSNGYILVNNKWVKK